MRTACHFDEPAPRIVIDIKSQHVIQHSLSTRKWKVCLKSYYVLVSKMKIIKGEEETESIDVQVYIH